MSLTEWAEDLVYTLKNSGHGLEQITLASAEGSRGFAIILGTARRVAGVAGWPVVELSVKDLRGLESLPTHGYLIIRAGSGRLAPEMPVAVAAFQHLVSEDLQVALLVLGAPKVIQALRREPGLDGLAEHVLWMCLVPSRRRCPGLRRPSFCDLKGQRGLLGTPGPPRRNEECLVSAARAGPHVYTQYCSNVPQALVATLFRPQSMPMTMFRLKPTERHLRALAPARGGSYCPRLVHDEGSTRRVDVLGMENDREGNAVILVPGSSGLRVEPLHIRGTS